MNYIPRKIHAVWFGRNSYSQMVKRCMESWQKMMPDYEIKVWNEDNFDISQNTYVKEAYEAKKRAYVSDYVRLYALYEEGGVYIDTDIEIIKSLNKLLEGEHVVTGYSSNSWIPTAIMASEKGNIWVKELLRYYDGRHFILPDGSFDLKANNIIITEMSARIWGFKRGDRWIKFGQVRLYPREYFQPYAKRVIDWKKENILELAAYHKYYKIDKENTYCIHYDTVSWRDDNTAFISHVKHLLRRILPQFIYEALHRQYYKRREW